MAKGGGTQTTSSQVQIPGFINEQARKNLAFGNTVANRPFEQYGGETVAPLTADQIAAADWMRSNLGAYSGYANEGLGKLSDLAGSARALLNPYLGDVERAALTAFGHEGAAQMNRLAESAGNAFGGSRYGVAEGVLGAQLAEKAGEISAGIRSAGWDKAISGALAQGSGLVSGAATGENIAESAGRGLFGVGTAEQQQTQAEMTDLWRRWQEKRDYPLEQLQILQEALAATPYSTKTTQTTPTTQNIAGNVLGGIGTIATIASLF